MVANAYLCLYDNYSESIKSLSQPCINAVRDEAYENLRKNGFDVFADEYEKDYGLNVFRVKPVINPYSTFSCGIPNIGAYVCFVLNDTFCPNAAAPQIPEGVIVCALAEAAEKHPDLVSRYYCKANAGNKGSEAINKLFASDGLFVYVPAGVHMDRPIQLINMMSAQSNLMALSHNLIIVEDDASAQIMVCDHVEGNFDYFANRFTEVYVGRNATYEHVKVEDSNSHNCNVCTLQLSLQEGSEVVSNIITLRNGKTRNTVKADINGEHAKISLNGLVIGGGTQICDNTTFINHFKGNSASSELFKYILDDKAKGNFYGLINVVKDAQKTVALQTNKNLCLSKEASMSTKPQLEIYADDVKCNHGATIGRIDENALFYMRQRGISLEEARMLLMFAFAKDVLDNIRIPILRERMESLIEKRLRGESADCHSCGHCV